MAMLPEGWVGLQEGSGEDISDGAESGRGGSRTHAKGKVSGPVLPGGGAQERRTGSWWE